MMKKFSAVAAFPESKKWENSISRIMPIEYKLGDMRSNFSRDYNRILHCTAYRRLRNKTQVFFSPKNEMICTRIEHVNLVTSVSNTIASELGLNSELTNAIAIGHDLGHAPFGHSGEHILNKKMQKMLGKRFWHEQNSFRVIDKIEILEDSNAQLNNLNLTYAVRDGILSHCGEINEKIVIPRNEFLDLEKIGYQHRPQPYTWEGCVVKVADKISYLGRDIEDAVRMKILDQDQIDEFNKILDESKIKHLNNTTLMHNFVVDLCENSSPENGIRMSDNFRKVMDSVKAYNYKYIYDHKRLRTYEKYAELMIDSLIEYLVSVYDASDTLRNLNAEQAIYPTLPLAFANFISRYTVQQRDIFSKLKNKLLYDLNNQNDYIQAVFDFIASLTDRNATEYFEELTRF
ncbi:MAG: HD domain-containing protein [Bacteroidales bacterium]|jgi:dGTPase|nr:HD domain-containing protein [Bacteroidales bacterium]